MRVKILAEGGAMKPGPALSQKLGPAGVPVNSVIQKVNDATKNFQGMKVPVELDIDTGTKEIQVRVFSPPVSELLKKEFGVEKGSGLQAKIKVANAPIEKIISIAKTKMPNFLCRDLKASVKTVLGSCVSLGILVENKSPKEVLEEIDGGKYDAEIRGEKTDVSDDKKKELEKYFEEVKKEQEKIAKQLEAKKEEEKSEEKKEEKPAEKK